MDFKIRGYIFKALVKCAAIILFYFISINLNNNRFYSYFSALYLLFFLLEIVFRHTKLEISFPNLASTHMQRDRDRER